MKGYEEIHRQAMSRLSTRSPYCGFSDLQMEVISQLLLAFLVENNNSDKIIDPSNLLAKRLHFLEICQRLMIELLVNYQKELFKGTRVRKYTPDTYLRLIAIGKTNLVTRSIAHHRYTIYDKVSRLPENGPNDWNLQVIFPNNGEAIPASMSFEKMLREYPWLVADCVGWSEIFLTE